MNLIQQTTEKLESFVKELNEFINRTAEMRLFKRFPVIESSEASSQRLINGRYLLRPCGVEFDQEDCGTAAIDLFNLLLKNMPERKDDITLLRESFISERLNIYDFLLKAFCNRGNEVLLDINSNSLPTDLCIFFALWYCRPFRQKAARRLISDLNLSLWENGYCPVCGHWPSLGHIETKEGHRTLWCAHCGTTWQYERIKCVFCSTTDQDRLELISLADDYTYYVQVCSKCRRYLKVVRSTESVLEFPFELVYLGTSTLDMVVASAGYIQENILSVRYDDPEGNELLLYRQEKSSSVSS